MKKVLFCMLAVCMVALAGCSKDDEPKDDEQAGYQRMVVNGQHRILNGTWVDIQFSKLNPDPHSSYKSSEPTKIEFGKYYDSPQEVYYIDLKGKEDRYVRDGECIVYTYDLDFDHNTWTKCIITECYYGLTVESNKVYFHVYKKNKKNDYPLPEVLNSRHFEIDFVSDTLIRLQDPCMRLPYIFVKQ